MDGFVDALPIILYVLAIVLVIIFIILGIKLIKTINKTNEILEDVEKKTKSLDGMFRVIDGVTDTLSVFSDTLVSGITSIIGKLIPKKKKKKEKKEDE